MLCADTVQPQEAPITHTLPAAQHANLHFVTPNLAVGGDLHPVKAADQLGELDDLGITHIVDCRIEWNDQKLVAEHLPAIAYLHHGMDDAGQQVPFTWFDEAIAWIDAAGPDAVVLTHCHMGINRGPSLGFAVLLHWGWDPIDAIAAIRAARPQANVWNDGQRNEKGASRRKRPSRQALISYSRWCFRSSRTRSKNQPGAS